ncbi:hypothetical protein Tco_1143324 [Tanacetum coccineum]
MMVGGLENMGRWIWKSSGVVAMVPEMANLKSDRGEVVVSEMTYLENNKVDMENQRWSGGGAGVDCWVGGGKKMIKKCLTPTSHPSLRLCWHCNSLISAMAYD